MPTRAPPSSMPWCNAAQSPPFMTDGARRGAARHRQPRLPATSARLSQYLADPLDTTELVFVAGGGKTPDALDEGVKEAKAKEHGVARSKVEDVLSAALEAAGLTLRPDAVKPRVTARVGDEAGRVPAIVEVLAAAYGSGARLDGRRRRALPR